MSTLKGNNDDAKEEEYFERMHPFCDGCGDEFWNVNLIECPNGWHGEHGEFYPYAFCEDCCRDSFEIGQCREDVEDCERAAEMMSDLLKKYAKENNFKTVESLPHAYLHESKIYCIGEWKHPPDEVLHDDVVHLDPSKLYEGTDYLLVKRISENASFDMDYVREIRDAFEELRCDFWGYSTLKKKPVLIISMAGVWAAVAPRVEEPDYELERESFIRKATEGSKFFDITEKDGLLIVEAEEMNFDWTKLDDEKFVELCCGIIKTFPRISNTQITEGSGDLGQDIRAVEVVETLLGKEERIWTVQCKHFQSRKVNSSDIQDIPRMYPILKYDVFCLMTSGFVSPSCQRLLELWQTESGISIKTDFWDRKKIEDFLRGNIDIYSRYFLRKKD